MVCTQPLTIAAIEKNYTCCLTRVRDSHLLSMPLRMAMFTTAGGWVLMAHITDRFVIPECSRPYVLLSSN
jgi:hypothetical protein